MRKEGKMSTEYISKFTGEEIDKKLGMLSDEAGENKFLAGDGTYKEIPEPENATVIDEQIKSAVEKYLTENPIDGSVSTEDIVKAVTAYMEENAENFKGESGEKGDQGEDGADGVTPNLTIGTVETLAAGSNATASISGTVEEPVLNLGIPRGKTGASGTGGSGGTIYYYKPVVIATTVGKYWKKDGTLGDSTNETDMYIKKVSATNLEQYLSVSEGEVYKITIGSVASVENFNVTQCVFLNDNDEFVTIGFDTTTSKTEELITVPEGATKMHFTVWTGTTFTIEKQTTEPYGIVNEFELLNEMTNLQSEGQTFARKTFAPFDKGYVTFVNDDCRTQVSEIVDVFVNKNVPLCLAAIYGAFNNIATNGTVLEAVRKAVENGGEVLSHAANQITEDTINNFNVLYEQFAKSKEMLELYGFDVNGIILAGGTGQIVGDNRTDKWARKYYQYSDLYGNSEYGYPYYHYRTALSNLTLDKAKALVDTAIENKEWVVFYLHEWAEFSQTDMETLLDYINEKDTHELGKVTYKQIYDNFCISYPKQITAITATKTACVYGIAETINTDDVTVIAYYNDGSMEKVTNGITVDLTSVNTSATGDYYAGITYKGKTVYIPITIYSTDDRVALYSGAEGYINWDIYTDGTLEFTSTAAWKVNIPNYTDGTQPWREHMSLIKRVKINSGTIGTIGEYAFYGATNLKELDFSGNSTTISLSSYAFANCGLTTPTINNVGGVSTGAFDGCPITELTLNANSLGYNAFNNCNSLTTVRLTNTTMSIDGGAFNSNKATLTDIYVAWAENAVTAAPWGAANATVHYNYTE